MSALRWLSRRYGRRDAPLTLALVDEAPLPHEIVTTLEACTRHHYCITCGATSRGVHLPPPPCPGRPT